MIITSANEITDNILLRCYNKFTLYELPKLKEMRLYYDGDEAVEKKGAVQGKPNHELVANWCKYISDVNTGYFMGIPVNYSLDDEASHDLIADINAANHEEDENYNLALDMSIYGRAYELVFMVAKNVDEARKIRFCSCDVMGTFMIRDNSILHEPVAAVRVWQETNELDDTEMTIGEVYTDSGIRKFRIDGGSITTLSEEINMIGMIPVIEFGNNKDLEGDFAKILRLQDAYNLTLSNSNDDLESIASAFLALEGMDGTEKEDIEEANATRVLKIAEGGKAYFVTKDINVEAVEANKKTVKTDLLQISQTPDLSDEGFAQNQSGVAMEFKLWGIEQNRSSKERKFKRGLEQRMLLIKKILELQSVPFKPDYIITFYKNLPQDTAKIVEWVVKLNGIVSQRTQLEQLPFIKSTQEEMDIIDAEALDEQGLAKVEIINPNIKKTDEETAASQELDDAEGEEV